MADFDPDKFLAETAPPSAQAAPAAAFDPDKFLAETAPRTPTYHPGMLDKAADAVKSGVSSVMAGPVGKVAAWVGDKLERGVDAPFRAGLGVAQTSNNPMDALAAAKNQFGEDTLPTTPSAKDIAAKAGLSTQPISERYPSLYSETGQGMHLQKGGPLDVSDAGVVGGIMQPSMWAIPGETLSNAAGKGLKGAGALAGKAAEAVAPTVAQVTGALGKGADLAKKGVFKAGEFMTGGGLDAEKAFKASEQLSGGQMLVPGSDHFGPLAKAGKAVGAARDVVQDAQAVVPGSQQVLQNVKDIIAAGEAKALRTPGSQAVLEKVDNLLGEGKDLHMGQVDDLVRNLDAVTYTPLGNNRSLEAMWGGPVAKARGALNDLLQTDAHGQALQGAKDQYSALSTAAKGRSKLMDGLANVGASASTGAMAIGAATHSPVAMTIGLLGAGFSRSMSPATYFQIVGAAKLPADMAAGLVKAYQSGAATAVRDAMTSAATAYPAEMSKVATAMSEAAHQGLPRVAGPDRPSRPKPHMPAE